MRASRQSTHQVQPLRLDGVSPYQSGLAKILMLGRHPAEPQTRTIHRVLLHRKKIATGEKQNFKNGSAPKLEFGNERTVPNRAALVATVRSEF